jgi:putative transposase
LLCSYLEHYHDIKTTQGALCQHLKKVGIRWKRVRLRVHSPDPLYIVKRERVEELRQRALDGELSASEATHPPPESENRATYLAYFDAADLHWCPDVGDTYSPVAEQIKVDSPGKSNPWYALFGSLIYPSGDGHYTIHERKRSVEVVYHLQGLIDRDPDGMWFVILDNASAHHTQAIKDFLAENRNRVELVYLPTYSPHLNLIERLWRMMRHQVTRGVFFQSLDDQALAVVDWLNHLPLDHFCSLMGVDEKQLAFV